MILVQSLRLLLNGNNIRTVFLLFLLGIMACSASKKSTVVPNKIPVDSLTVKEPKETKEDKKKQEEEFKKKKHPDLPAFENDFNIVIFLPLYLDKDLAPSSQEAQVQSSVLDYYQGILLALDSLKKEGINVKVHVMDTQRDSLLTIKLIQKLPAVNPDLIIGPLDVTGFKMVSDYSNANMVPLVAPFNIPDDKKPLNNPYAFFCNPSLKSYGKRLATYFINSAQPVNIIYLSDSSETDRTFYSGFSESLASRKINIKKMRITGDMNISSYMVNRDSTRNIVVIPTDVESKANSVIRSLKAVDTGKYSFSIVGLESWENFKIPDYQHWQRMNLYLLSNHFEASDSLYKNFYYQYRAMFEVPPTSLSLRGFDQTLFFGRALLTFGKSFPKYIQSTDFSAIHNHFFWTYAGNVVQNESVNLLQFSEFRFIRIDY